MISAAKGSITYVVIVVCLDFIAAPVVITHALVVLVVVPFPFPPVVLPGMER